MRLHAPFGSIQNKKNTKTYTKTWASSSTPGGSIFYNAIRKILEKISHPLQKFAGDGGGPGGFTCFP